MTKTFGVNSNNDLYIGSNGNLVLLSGLDAVQAACLTASKAQLREMVLAQNGGIPNFQTVWVGSPNLSIFKAYLRQTLLNVEGVTSVIDLVVDATDNILSYTAKIQSEFGPIAIADQLRA